MKVLLYFFLFALPGLYARASAGQATIYSSGQSPAVRNPVDTFILGDLRARNLTPAEICSDPVFLRRAYLDVIGTLPTALEARAFIFDKNPYKRRELVDKLLAREEFKDYWGMKWCELLRVKSEYPINLWPNAAQAYDRWIRTSLDLPYDQFAYALLTASGSNFRDPPANFYRATQDRKPTGLASTVALTFMGERTGRWPGEKLSQMSVFFSRVAFKATDEWKEEIVYSEPSTNPAPQPAVFPDGTTTTLGPNDDPRIAFAKWLIRPENPWFARAMANRIWFWLMGRGIVHEPDDMGPHNPPSNPELLRCLEQELVDAHFDVKKLFRMILNSSTYQLSISEGNEELEKHFGAYAIRPLEAETLLDAINQITGSNDRYTSTIPEPFTFIPAGERAIELPDGSISSPFLELYGRPARDSGLTSERNAAPSSSQRLHLLNSSHILKKIEQSTLVRASLSANRTVPEGIRFIYMTVLSRPPSADELAKVERYAQDNRLGRREAATDLVWALINSSEFLHRH